MLGHELGRELGPELGRALEPQLEPELGRDLEPELGMDDDDDDDDSHADLGRDDDDDDSHADLGRALGDNRDTDLGRALEGNCDADLGNGLGRALEDDCDADLGRALEDDCSSARDHDIFHRRCWGLEVHWFSFPIQGRIFLMKKQKNVPFKLKNFTMLSVVVRRRSIPGIREGGEDIPLENSSVYLSA
jgi:hypothetical protein